MGGLEEIVKQAIDWGMAKHHADRFARYVAERMRPDGSSEAPVWVDVPPLSEDWSAIEEARSIIVSHEVGEMQPVKEVRREIVAFLETRLAGEAPDWVKESGVALLPWTILGTPTRYVQQFVSLVGEGEDGNAVRLPYFDYGYRETVSLRVRPTRLIRRILEVSNQVARTYGVGLDAAVSTVITASPCKSPALQISCSRLPGLTSQTVALSIRDGLKTAEWAQAGALINLMLRRSERSRGRSRNTLRQLGWTLQDQASMISQRRHPAAAFIQSAQSEVVEERSRTLRFRAKDLKFPRVNSETVRLLQDLVGQEGVASAPARARRAAYIKYLDSYFATLDPPTSHEQLSMLDWRCMALVEPWDCALQHAVLPGLMEAMALAEEALRANDVQSFDMAVDASPLFKALCVGDWRDDSEWLRSYGQRHVEDAEVWASHAWQQLFAAGRSPSPDIDPGS
ncbi:MAG TPA: hypothetical protein VHE55_05245 [Fimbriimonadaceae bacterium]|nr:hypothetical protein [Fimbriimonadaceae bacterium]